MTASEFIQSTFSGVKFFLKKNSPEIMAISGFAVTAAAGVIAVIKTPKAIKQYEERKMLLTAVDKCLKEGKTADDEEYTIEDAAKDVKLINGKTIVETVKIYALPAAMVIAGGVLTFLGCKMNKKRYAELAAAYTTLAASYAAYKENVRKRLGDKAEGDITIGYTPKEEKEGEEPSEKKFTDFTTIPEYARIFDETNPHFKRQPTYNEYFLSAQERAANDLLRIRSMGVGPKVVFLNEVYKMLGYEETQEGSKVGWKAGSTISFGHRNANYESSCRFMAGMQPEVILIFNIDGYVLDQLPKV